MKLKFLRTSTVGSNDPITGETITTVYAVGETAEVNKDSALILIRKGRAKQVQVKSKTANSNKED